MTLSFSFGPDWFQSLAFEIVFQVIGDPLDLPAGFSAANYKKISKGGKAGNIQKNQVQGLETNRLPGAQDGPFFAAHLYSGVFALLFVSRRDSQIWHHYSLSDRMRPANPPLYNLFSSM